jgi:hypothetical protein
MASKKKQFAQTGDRREPGAQKPSPAAAPRRNTIHFGGRSRSLLRLDAFRTPKRCLFFQQSFGV